MSSPRRTTFHEPVLVDAVLELLQPGPGWTCDCTLGAGGHARALLGRAGSGRLLGIDADQEAVAEASQQLARIRNNAEVVIRHASYVHLADIVMELNLQPVTGVLFDLGASYHQLTAGERGFSFDSDGPLDMRFDPGRGKPAAEVLRTASRKQVQEWLSGFGEEHFAGRIARRIDEERGRLRTTRDLAEVVRGIVPGRFHRKSLSRVFQALRIVVNRELENVRQGIDAALEVLAPGGRCVVISYHSLEDRIAKNRFRDGARAGELNLLTKKPLRPGDDEVARNPAARSARLRAAEKAAK